MSRKTFKLFFSLCVILALGVVPSFAASAVVGSMAGGTNVTVGGQAVMPNTTLFSGDSLRVRDGAAVVAMGMGSRMVFGRESVASFERGADEVTVTLGQGNVSMYHPADGVGLCVKVGEVSVIAGKGYKSLGEVAMVNGAVVVTAKDGTLKVEGPGRSMELTKGKTIEITPKAAGSPAPGQAGAAGAGTAASHLTGSEWLAFGSIAAGGASTVTGVVSIKRSGDAKTAANAAQAASVLANTNALAATAAAQAAQAAAAAAQAEATKVCKAASPAIPGC